MKHHISFFIFLCIPILLSGCWNHRELTDIGIVSAVGIDYGSKNTYKLTFQIINPKNVAGDQLARGLSGPAFSIYECEGDNILEAARAATQNISRQLYFAHTNVFMISEEVARDGIRDLLDLPLRSPDFRTTATVVIAKDAKAEEILKTLTPIDQIPAKKIDKTLKYSQNRWGESTYISVGELISFFHSNGKQGIISGFTINGKREKGSEDANIQSSKPLAPLKAEGIALFKMDKLIAWADGKTARGINWILDNIKATAISVDWKEKKNAFGISITLSKTKVIAKLKNGKPEFTVHVDAEGTLSEANTYLDLSKSSELLKLQIELRKKIKRELETSIQFAQKYKTDVFGFGEKLSHIDEDYWKKVKHNWNDEIFPNLKVNVEVDATITRTQLISKPFIFE